MKKSELRRIIREEVIQKIKESPDIVYYNGGSHLYRDNDAITFGYFDNVLYTSEDIDPNYTEVLKPYTHYDLGTWIAKLIFDEEIPEPKNYDPDEEYYIDREDFKLAGRLWTRSKIISFWEYPKTAAELDKVIKDLNKKIPGLNLNDDWKIDLGVEKDRLSSSKVEPISSYKSSKEATPADAGKAHIAFNKQGNVPSGVGSKFKFKNQIPGETVAQMRARTKTSESKMYDSDQIRIQTSELRSLLKEMILNEIGEGTNPYDYVLDDSGETYANYSFTVEDGTVYDVFFEMSGNRKVMKIEFGIVHGQKVIHNITFMQSPKQLFRILTTIKKIVVEDLLDKYDINTILFSASEGKLGNHKSHHGSDQRKSVYTAYIKKMFPNATVITRASGDIEVQLNN